MKLTAKFLSLLIGIPLLILIITSSITFSIQKNSLEREIIRQQEHLASEVTNGITAEMNGLAQKAKDIAGLPIVKKILTDPPPLQYNQDVFYENPHYEQYLETMEPFDNENVSLAYLVSAKTGVLILNTWIDLPGDYDGRIQDYYTGPVE